MDVNELAALPGGSVVRVADNPTAVFVKLTWANAWLGAGSQESFTNEDIARFTNVFGKIVPLNVLARGVE